MHTHSGDRATEDHCTRKNKNTSYHTDRINITRHTNQDHRYTKPTSNKKQAYQQRSRGEEKRETAENTGINNIHRRTTLPGTAK